MDQLAFEVFQNEIAQASSRVQLDELHKAVTAAWAGGRITDNQAELLHQAIETKRRRPRVSRRSRVGSRPRRPEHVARRRKWAASSWLPPHVVAQTTVSEQAVLSLVAWQHCCRGVCDWSHQEIATRVGVCVSMVKSAIAMAAELHLVSVQVRRVSAWRNDTNVVRIICPAWTNWIRMRPRGVGSNLQPPSKFNKKQEQARHSSLRKSNGQLEHLRRLPCVDARARSRKSPGGAGAIGFRVDYET